MKRAATAAALVLLLSACGSGADGQAASAAHDHGASSPVVEGAREIPVSGKNLRFQPETLEVAAGEDVTIVFTAADVPHDLSIAEAGVHVGAKAGQTAKGGLRIDEPGTYTYVCTVRGHEAAGMRGTLTVTPA